MPPYSFLYHTSLMQAEQHSHSQEQTSITRSSNKERMQVNHSNNKEPTLIMQRNSKTANITHKTRQHKEVLEVPSDNQASCPPTFATATAVWAACWRELCGTRAVATKLLVQILQKNY
jgi:hypothetical protein